MKITVIILALDIQVLLDIKEMTLSNLPIGTWIMLNLMVVIRYHWIWTRDILTLDVT